MTKTKDVRGNDIIDSRDIITRIKELAKYRQQALDSAVESEDTWTGEDGDVYATTNDWDEETESEYRALTALEESCSHYGEGWRCGKTLIKDSHFETYTEEFAYDIGAVQKGTWLNDHIDWESAAEALKMDYTEVELDGESYWIRS